MGDLDDPPPPLGKETGEQIEADRGELFEQPVELALKDAAVGIG